MTKTELRKIYLAKQRSLSQEDRAEKSRQISYRFFNNFSLDNIKFLHCFIAIEKFNEIDTAPILQRLWREFPEITTVVPRVDFKTGELQNLRFSPDTALIKNIWDIHEPSHSEYVETEKIDLVLAPLICFDEAGRRVGYGKGFYDRLLKQCRDVSVKIGLSFFPPVEEIEDANELDIPLDYCVTAEGIFSSKKG